MREIIFCLSINKFVYNIYNANQGLKYEVNKSCGNFTKDMDK